MTWIKICGITNLEDALTAVDAGADALGFVFYEKSPRNIDSETAREIVAKLSGQVEKVGLFIDQSMDDIRATAKEIALTAAQVYGDMDHVNKHGEGPCLKLIPALSLLLKQDRPEDHAMMWNPDAVYAFLLDSGAGANLGGTGQTFDWVASKSAVEIIKRLGNVIVAGGLTPENVGEAMRILSPWGVDISSGVEARPGKKDPAKVRAFIDAVRRADSKN